MRRPAPGWSLPDPRVLMPPPAPVVPLPEPHRLGEALRPDDLADPDEWGPLGYGDAA